jgi:hypothetical protein
MRATIITRMFAMTALLACVALVPVPPATAADAPRSYVASPDVYKVIAENNRTRVISGDVEAGSAGPVALATSDGRLLADRLRGADSYA